MTNTEHAKHAFYILQLGVQTNDAKVIAEAYTYSEKFVNWDNAPDALFYAWNDLTEKGTEIIYEQSKMRAA